MVSDGKLKLFILGALFGLIVGFFIPHHEPIKPDLNSRPTLPQKSLGSVLQPQPLRSSVSKPGKEPKFEKEKEVEVMSLLDQAKDFDSHDQVGEALNKFKEALELSPENRETLSGYAHFLAQKKMWSDALPLVRKCLALFPKTSSCHDDLTNYLVTDGSPEEQRDALKNCLANVPDDLVCMNNLGVYYLSQKKPQKAIDVYTKMLSLNGAHGLHFLDEHLHGQLAGAFEEMGNMSEAKIHYAESCRLGNQRACQRNHSLDSDQLR